MSFLYPNMLFGLLALAIPIVVHLFNFRRHKIVYFSDTATLKTIEQECQDEKAEIHYRDDNEDVIHCRIGDCIRSSV